MAAKAAQDTMAEVEVEELVAALAVADTAATLSQGMEITVLNKQE
jgi:hypothetical protein